MSPKESFIKNESESAKRWLDISDSSLFQRACEVTLLQLLEGLDAPADPVKAAALHHEMMGARAALRQLRNIAVKATATRPTPDWELTRTPAER